MLLSWLQWRLWLVAPVDWVGIFHHSWIGLLEGCFHLHCTVFQWTVEWIGVELLVGMLEIMLIWQFGEHCKATPFWGKWGLVGSVLGLCSPGWGTVSWDYSCYSSHLLLMCLEAAQTIYHLWIDQGGLGLWAWNLLEKMKAMHTCWALCFPWNSLTCSRQLQNC